MKVAAATLVLIAVVSSCFAQQRPIFVERNSGWGNTGVQQNPPVALIVSAGVCIFGDNCNDFGGTAEQFLVPMTFYPSGCTQHVTISSGTALDNIAGVFAQGGTIVVTVPRSLSNDGSVPSNFFMGSQENGGPFKTKPATVTSIEMAIAPFTFQLNPGGWWEAIGKDGNAPLMNFYVYGSFQ